MRWTTEDSWNRGHTGSNCHFPNAVRLPCSWLWHATIIWRLVHVTVTGQQGNEMSFTFRSRWHCGVLFRGGVFVPMQEGRRLAICGPQVIRCFLSSKCTTQVKAQAECCCQFNWAIILVSFSMLSTVGLSLGQMVPPPHSCPEGGAKGCPGRRGAGWGGEGRHPLRNWPLTTSVVLQMSRQGLANPQTSLVATTLVLAQTSTLLGLQMTSLGRWQKHSLYVLERSVCDRMTLLLTPALFVVFSFIFIYRILGSSMNHLCRRVFDEKEMCFEMLQL